ncbi:MULTISPECIES: MFS transporter [Microvirgula]|nr:MULTISPECIES: MFS transporter [Microvirgula]RAS13390.1 cyanate permease [Microvirgula sp. AG722]
MLWCAALQGWRALSPAARMLVGNGLAFNLGFYMMMPFLAQHLGALGLTGWASGLVMGMRVFSQQGLFLLGGMLGDRLGYRPAILLGCLIRSAGFVLLGWAVSLPVLFVAAFLTGFAGALFTPCAHAFLAAECRNDAHRRQAFALHNLVSEAGMLLGPLVGMLLTGISYAVTGLAAGGIFLLLTILQWRWLPRDPVDPARREQGVLAQWSAMIRNRAFMAFTLLAACYQLLFHQLYLAVPAYIGSHGYDTGLLSGVFTLSALIGVTLQLPASELVRRRLGVAWAMGLGLGLMGMSYLLLPLLAAWPVTAALLQAACLSLGSILCFPLFAAFLPSFADSRALGGHYGFYASVGGCVALIGNVAVGFALGEGGRVPPLWLWLVLAACGMLAGGLLFRLVRRWDASSSL